MIPPLDERGNLPPGIHRASWSELEIRFGSTSWRRALLVGLRAALDSLRQSGCRTVYVDGSFVSDEPAPGDFDACWEVTGVVFEDLDPVLLDFSDGRSAQKARFRGELFPADLVAEPTGLPFLDFFQHDRDTGDPKGVVEIDLETGL
jgi:hypothetical protein